VYRAYVQVGKDKQLGFDPCMVSWFLKGDFVMVGGSDSKCGVYTKDGVRIGTIGEMPSWVWSAKQKPKDQAVVSLTLILPNRN
jgi:intraflagellar transport protein 122